MKASVLVGVLALAFVGASVYAHDKAANYDILRDAYTAQRIGALVESGYSDAGPTLVMSWRESPIGTLLLKLLPSDAEPPALPVLWRGTMTDVVTASRHYVTTIRAPQGTWMTYTRDLADARMSLSKALTAAEVSAVSAGVRADASATVDGIEKSARENVAISAKLAAAE